MQLLVIFVIIFVIYGAGWIWQTVNDLIRDSQRNRWDPELHPEARGGRALLAGHDLADLCRSWQSFAEERGGELHARQLFQSPKVSFIHHGARALLSIYKSGDDALAPQTQLTYTVPEGWPYRLEVRPQVRTDDGEDSGLLDIRLEDPEFDPRYVVTAFDPKFAREFLDGAARQTVEELRRLTGNDHVLLSLNSSRLMIRKEGVIAQAEDLDALADLAGRLHDRIDLFWQRSSGIEILEETAPTGPAADAICQICGSKIEADVRVVCRRCSTPHHKDCWEFNGRCSTYACGEKRFASK
jgi:hypothetical protein